MYTQRMQREYFDIDMFAPMASLIILGIATIFMFMGKFDKLEDD